MYFSTRYTSPIGEMFIVSDGDAVVRIGFCSQRHSKSDTDDEIAVNDNLDVFKKVTEWLDDYFGGLNPEINFKLKPEGTKFRQKVWKMLEEIPYGETVTYGEIASKISPTMASQAVGGAIGANPIAIVIPCHRVIGKNGKLTGYAAGLDKKIELLRLENSLGENYEL